MTYQLGDTAQCKNCPETITYLTGRSLFGKEEAPSWFHTRDSDGRTMKLRHCIHPRTPSIAEPVQD